MVIKGLSLRAFGNNIKRATYEKQKEIGTNSDGDIKCIKRPHENGRLNINQMESDHIIPWNKGGKTREITDKYYVKSAIKKRVLSRFYIESKSESEINS
ncbi:hypothetical protein [Helicobacter bilis]|uniref:HNH endonuclease n=1 Tax=Helicobacter bilis TaxID=37372 RepID=A0A4U8U758_9HELI|nr:hypothetical protein [Helicobacter bilis]MCI7411974.1 hypothetical protein [Helicobacter bilis]MDD7296424.1 hypothetical protein [Helicobacter bilis]MDY4399063.1 hypothetical protein [Helicobacter bilis]TLE07812.1 hypothetical protein LS78_007620 [Helicobacter bilis]TLE09536.1 hypothetical protein LS79_007815 [Helicobacter bilis]